MSSNDRFQIDDFRTICDFIHENPFGILVSNASNLENIAIHLPFQLEDCGDEIVVYAHISRHNPHIDQIKDGKQALIIFQGPNAYVSSSVYGHPNVPTWNYQAVHLYGNIEFLTDEQLDSHLKDLVDTHEKKRTSPLSFESIDVKMIETYKKDILGFRLLAYKSEAIFKLSQNRNKEDFDNIIIDLKKERDTSRVAEVMERLQKD